MSTRRVRTFCFTWNNPAENWQELLTQLEPHFLIAGKEVAPTTGTRHLQGYIRWNTLKTLSGVIELFNVYKIEAHVSMANGTAKQNVTYCSKEDTTPFIIGEIPKQGRRSDIEALKETIDAGATIDEIWDQFPTEYLKYHKCIKERLQSVASSKQLVKMRISHPIEELRQWQTQLLKRLMSQGDRKVLWAYDTIGGLGKTWLAKHLISWHSAFYIMNGKCADISHAFNCQNIVVFDLCRSLEDHVNYTIIEQFKNGVMWSPKYQSTTKIFDPCKVIIFANFSPNRSKLSEDRWDVVNLRPLQVQAPPNLDGFIF